MGVADRQGHGEPHVGPWAAELFGSAPVEELEADPTVVFPIGETADLLDQDPVPQNVPSAKDGRLIVLEDPESANAFSSGSTLGIPHALDEIVPLIRQALED